MANVGNPHSRHNRSRHHLDARISMEEDDNSFHYVNPHFNLDSIDEGHLEEDLYRAERRNLRAASRSTGEPRGRTPTRAEDDETLDKAERRMFEERKRLQRESARRNNIPLLEIVFSDDEGPLPEDSLEAPSGNGPTSQQSPASSRAVDSAPSSCCIDIRSTSGSCRGTKLSGSGEEKSSSKNSRGSRGRTSGQSRGGVVDSNGTLGDSHSRTLGGKKGQESGSSNFSNGSGPMHRFSPAGQAPSRGQLGFVPQDDPGQFHPRTFVLPATSALGPGQRFQGSVEEGDGDCPQGGWVPPNEDPRTPPTGARDSRKGSNPKRLIDPRHVYTRRNEPKSYAQMFSERQGKGNFPVTEAQGKEVPGYWCQPHPPYDRPDSNDRRGHNHDEGNRYRETDDGNCHHDNNYGNCHRDDRDLQNQNFPYRGFPQNRCHFDEAIQPPSYDNEQQTIHRRHDGTRENVRWDRGRRGHPPLKGVDEGRPPHPWDIPGSFGFGAKGHKSAPMPVKRRPPHRVRPMALREPGALPDVRRLGGNSVPDLTFRDDRGSAPGPLRRGRSRPEKVDLVTSDYLNEFASLQVGKRRLSGRGEREEGPRDVPDPFENSSHDNISYYHNNNNNPSEPCAETRDDRGSLSAAGEDRPPTLARCKRHRQYRQYTMEEYRRLKEEMQMGMNRGSLGPDVQSEGYREKKEKAEKQKRYSDVVTERNRRHLEAAKSRSLQGTARDVRVEGREAPVPDRRKLVKEYAKTVPRPRVRETPVFLLKSSRERKEEKEKKDEEGRGGGRGGGGGRDEGTLGGHHHRRRHGDGEITREEFLLGDLDEIGWMRERHEAEKRRVAKLLPGVHRQR